MADEAAREAPRHVGLGEAARLWARIGWTSFGGPAGQIAMMQRELVETRRWIGQARFLHALNYCMLLPGPEAQQLATYVGWLMHGTRGGLVAGGLFVLPGVLVVMAWCLVYATMRELPAVAGLLFGLKAAVLAIVIAAVRRLASRALPGTAHRAIAIVAFVAMAGFALPFPFVVLGAAVLGVLAGRFTPALWSGRDAAVHDDDDALVDRLAASGALAHTRASVGRLVRVIVIGAALWLLPLVVVAALLGPRSILVDEGVFFAETAMVTFGGAYAVLAHIAQQAVEQRGWLDAAEMLDGLGLAETTPGPLILVVQFVGFMGAFHQPGGLAPLGAGVLGALVTMWVTFVPCFVWIFAGAPYVEAVRGNRWLRAALAGITAAVVGVIADLSLWFGVRVLFARVGETAIGPLRIDVPEPASLDLAALILAVLASIALSRWGLVRTLLAITTAGLLWRVVGPEA